ncbi:MAG: O-succinylhomoserine sulfhydrylase [Magnetococcales bacterium]|nr:O-succinylhomoserine sulfhydrylase [Magnetococcales bacterium]
MADSSRPQFKSQATQALHSGIHRTGERENSPAIFVTSSFAYESAAQAQAVFAGSEEGNVYSRFSNPTVEAFEERTATLEGGEKGLATASGMAAITATFLSLLSSGDHVVISQAVFGSTSNIASSVLSRMGIGVTRVPLSDTQAWAEAITPQTKLLFLETPANPTLEMGDLAAIGELAKKNDLLVAVDNVFCTPILQQPLRFGAHLVIHSGTKYMDGQGRVLGGVIVGGEELLMDKIYPFLRNTGPALSPFNAWVLLKGLETLPLRMKRHCKTALSVAQKLAQRDDLRGKVYYPGLPSHPQHQLASRQMSGYGGILCLELGSREQAHAFIDRLQLATITANLGDTRTLVTHPATTTHGRLSPHERLSAGVTDGLVRLSMGLEDAGDIIDDLTQALGNNPDAGA